MNRVVVIMSFESGKCVLNKISSFKLSNHVEISKLNFNINNNFVYTEDTRLQYFLVIPLVDWAG